MEAVDREPLEAEQDAEVVFKLCQVRAAVVHVGSTISAATDKSAIPTRRKRSVAKGTSPSDIVKYTDQTETPTLRETLSCPTIYTDTLNAERDETMHHGRDEPIGSKWTRSSMYRDVAYTSWAASTPNFRDSRMGNGRDYS